jgi:Secretion system C-terminal sorting domain
MKKLLTLFFVLISSISFAQEIEWQNTIGGSSVDELTSILQTNDGGYLLGGCSISSISGDKTESCFGTYDYWVVKTDSFGNIQWQKTIGGVNSDKLTSMVHTTDGGYLLAGYSFSPITNGDNDYLIVKLNSMGIILWTAHFGGDNEDNLFSAIQTTDGGYFLGGYSWSGVSGDKSEPFFGANDYWIVKTDSMGLMEWENTLGGVNFDEICTVIQTSDGGYLVAGTSDSWDSFDKSENCIGGKDFWIFKINSIGIIQWQNTIGGISDDRLHTVIKLNDNGYILGGYSFSDISGDKTENSKGLSDYWIVKVDSSGNIQWQKTIGGDLDDQLHSLNQTNDGGYILGGFSDSGISGDKTENQIGDKDYWIVKTDSLGNIQWQNTIGGSDIDVINSVIQCDDYGYLVAGSSRSDISDDKIENNIGFYDYWIVKFNEDHNLIQGQTYADLNSNQQQDPGETGIPNLKLTETNSGRYAFSQPNGYYSLAILDSGNFEVTPDYLNLYNPVPLTHTGNFSAIQQIDSLNDFAFQPTGTFNDLCISISPVGNFRSGFNANYALNYSNLGTTTLIPTIVFYPDNNVTFVSASITPTTITPDSIVFVLGTMNPFQSGQITITVNVNTGLPIGTLINSGALILPIANDANPGCNSSFWEVFTTGSFDPNDIIVNRKFIYDFEMPAPPYLEYIIRYQNTGNDTAFTVKILNPLDTNRLDLSTLENVATSHPADIRFVYHERNLEFVMNNILLPDSNINEPMSHGFVRYRIKPKSTVAVGDSIQSFAAIYFDFNTPVITNTAVTKIIQPTGGQEIPQGNISIFPNPTNNKVTIRLTETTEKITAANVFNLYGQEVKSFRIPPTHTAEIDISDLSQGVYFIKLNNNNQLISKIVKY